MENKRQIWSDASVPGLVLGGIVIAFSLITNYVSPAIKPGILGGLLTGCAWVAKLLGCIVLFKSFMRKFASYTPDAGSSDTFRFGIAMAIYSALIVAAFNLLFITVLAPDTFQEAMDAALSQYSSMLDSNSRQALDELAPRMPAISFFSNLIYCFLWGLVLSAIFSRSIPGNNPFEGQE